MKLNTALVRAGTVLGTPRSPERREQSKALKLLRVGADSDGVRG
jgi:hypothetical protein